MKYILCLLLLMMIVYNPVFAQTQTDEIHNPKQVGVTFSTLSGTGIHFLQPITEKDNLKFTAVYIYSNDNEYKESFFSLGAEYQWDLYEDRNKRGHLILGGHIDNNISENLYFSGIENKQSYFSMGTGLGFDLGSSDKGIILNAHITYQLTTNIGGEKNTRIGWGGGVGLGFNF